MHARYAHADKLSCDVIGAAVEVHKVMGPGLLEGIYEKCLSRELALRGIGVTSQCIVRVRYKDLEFDEALRCDLVVEGCLLLELKAVESVLPAHKAQLLSYMKLLDVPVGLLFNFHAVKLTDGIHRLILKGADQ